MRCCAVNGKLSQRHKQLFIVALFKTLNSQNVYSFTVFKSVCCWPVTFTAVVFHKQNHLSVY